MESNNNNKEKPFHDIIVLSHALAADKLST